MNFVYLSPHFPPNFQHFCHRLRDFGVNVLGVADTSYDELPQALKDTLTEYFRVDDMLVYDQLVRALGYLTWKHGRLDRIESHNEFWLETEAALRTDFNVSGPKRDEIEWVKRKSRMKEIFRKAGVTVASGGRVRNLADAEAMVSALGYPVVLKPDIGVGAAGAIKASDREALLKAFAGTAQPDYMLEEFIDGTLCSFDGLVDGGNNIVFCTAHVFRQGILETVRDNDDIYYYSMREIPADLEKAGRASVKAFDVRERFFHIEFFRRHKDEKIVAVEINMRPPGGLTTEMFNYANDIDVYREWANVVANGRFEAQWSRPYHCMYIGRKDHRTYRHSHEEVVRDADGLLVHHERMQSAFAAAIGDHGYLVRSAELEPLLGLARFALEVE